MSGPVHALVPAPSTAAASRQRPAPRRSMSRRGDASEREADRAAEVVARGGSVSSWSFSAVPTSRDRSPTDGAVQRDDAGQAPKPATVPKDEKEKYTEAAAKAGEAALETKEGKALKDRILEQPAVKRVTEAASSPAGIATIVGVAGAGVAGLAATGRELPFQPPALPLDKVLPGLSAKVTVKGPLNAPTEVGLVLTFREQGPKQKRAAADREKEQLAAQVAELRAFQAGLTGAPGAKQAADDRQFDEAIAHVVARNSMYSGLFIPLDPARRAAPAPERPTADAPVAAPTEPAVTKDDESAPVQRERASDGPTIGDPTIGDRAPSPQIDGAVAAGGRPLDPSTRHFMEARFGVDFSAVRIHDGMAAAEVARGIDAAAFTTGTDVVFGTGRFDPESPAGRHLLAHELSHVVQQSRATPASSPLQRRGVGEWLGILFGIEEGNWTTEELSTYLQLVTKTRRIEGSYDSDNKARAIVARWKAGDAGFQVSPAQKVLLIEEMLDGPTLIEDETAIVDLLVEGTQADGATVLGTTGTHLDRIEADVDDKIQRARLSRWLTATFVGGRDAVLAGRLITFRSTVEGFDALTTGTVSVADAAPVVQVPKIVVDAMAEAWKNSFPKGKSHEQGGILVRKKDGSVEWITATKSNQGMTELPEDKIPKGGAGLVAGHTHPYDESERKNINPTSTTPEGLLGIGESAGDFATLVFQRSPVDIVHAGNVLFAVVKTKEFNDAVAAAKDKKKFAEKIGNDWIALLKASKGTGSVQDRVRAAARGICRQYSLVMYQGAPDGLITKVDVSK